MSKIMKFIITVGLMATAASCAVSQAATVNPVTPSTTASVPAPSTTEPSTPPPAKVAVIGDSLIFQTLEEEKSAFTTAGFTPTVVGFPGKPITDPLIQEQVQAVSHDATVQTVVLVTTSNDNVKLAKRTAEVGQEKAVAEYRQNLLDAQTMLGSRCVVWVTARTESNPMYFPQNASLTNKVLSETVSSPVADWATVSAGHSDWFVADQLHFDDGTTRHEDGALAYASLLAQAATRCPR